MFGTGFRTFMPGDIEVLRDELGKPYVRLYGGALEQFEKMEWIRSMFLFPIQMDWQWLLQ